jgi:nucleoside-diphosphate-sugar epimerase
MTQRRRVLVTGASGLIGGIIREGLDDAYELTGVDVRRSRRVPIRKATMTRLSAVQPAFEGQDVVIDLAASADARSPWKAIYENNLPATYNALEAARRAGVTRLIYASSNHATGMYEQDHPYSAILAGNYQGLDPDTIPRIAASAPVRPDGPYGVGKVFGEAAGRYYADNFGLSVICLRIGHVNRDSRPFNSRHFSVLLTARDLVHLVERCIEAPEELSFGVFYAVSNNTWRIWDIEDACRAVGYRPRDNAETWRSAGR